MNTLIANKYIISELLGSGCFSSVYKGKHNKTDANVAIKFETFDTENRLLQHEVTILKYLYENGVRNIPAVYWYGKYNSNTCLVMSLYDCSLYSYILNKNIITVSSIHSIIYQLIVIFESIHKNYIIHRDIKPQNIMIKNGILYIIDFGFSVFYIDSDRTHIEDICTQNIIGSPKYVSYNIHCGSIPSRRDDLISIGYIFYFMCNKDLPWDNIIIDTTVIEEYDDTHILNSKNIMRQKLKEKEYILNKSNTISTKLYNYLKYVYNLEYSETPNYTSINELFNGN